MSPRTKGLRLQGRSRGWGAALLVAAIALVLSRSVGLAGSADRMVLAPFFDIERVEHQSSLTDFSCATPPAVPSALLDDEDPAVNNAGDEEIDPAAIGAMNAYGNVVARMADDAIAVVAGADMVGGCAIQWLAQWARAGALVALRSRPGIHIRKWELAAYAAAYTKVRHWATPEDAAAVEAWLGVLGHTVVEDFSTDTHLPSRRNNHLHWAIWGVANAAVATGDVALWDWARTRYVAVLETVPEDGFLPLELERGTSALGYHIYATAPLVLTGEILQRNGIDVYAIGDGSLHRLVARSLDGLEDPTIFALRAGVEQEVEPIIRPTRMSWLEIYNARFPSARAERWLADLRPVGHRTYGGNLTRLFH